MLDTSEFFAHATFAQARKGGCIDPTKSGVGTKLEIVTDAKGIPLHAFTDSANVAEVHRFAAMMFRITVSIATLDGVLIPHSLPTFPCAGFTTLNCWNSWAFLGLRYRFYEYALRETLIKKGVEHFRTHRKNHTAESSHAHRKLRR